MMATRSQMDSITDIWCVMMTTVIPRFRLMSRSRPSIDSVVFGSRAEVASSQSRSFGSDAMALAIATRCFCPPESCEGYAFSRSASPTSVKSCLALASASVRRTPISSSGKQMFRSTVLCSSRLNCWKIMPIERRTSRRSLSFISERLCPSKNTSPEVGRSR